MNVNWPSALSVPTQVVVSLVAATVVTARESVWKVCCSIACHCTKAATRRQHRHIARTTYARVARQAAALFYREQLVRPSKRSSASVIPL
jgi:hypothetical protein